MFDAEADDSASFDCETDPPFPLLAMRIGPLSLRAPTCQADESASASCPIQLDWPSACTAGPEEQPHMEAACCWLPDCVTGAVFEADAFDDTSFDCVSDPSSPQLAMRTGSLTFDAPIWVAEDAAAAPWSTELDWPVA